MKGLDFASARPNDPVEQEEEDESETESAESDEGDASTDEQAGTSTKPSPDVRVAENKQPITIPKIGKDSRLVMSAFIHYTFPLLTLF